MDKFVEVVLVASAEVDEGLDGLVGVRGNVLSLASLDDLDCIVDEERKVCDAVIDVRRFVYPDKRLVEDCEQVAE